MMLMSSALGMAAVGCPDYWQEGYWRALPRDRGALCGSDFGPPDARPIVFRASQGHSARVPSLCAYIPRYQPTGNDAPTAMIFPLTATSALQSM
eukprot:9500341-Pyramimonas_sp.AAC.1